jgi:putative peptide zinc metalloprotease protein
MYIEILIATITGFVWSMSDDGLLKQTCFHLMLSVCLATIIGNANALMRLDGYYILADWLEIPNLYQKGQRSLLRLVRCVFLGDIRSKSKSATSSGAMIATYGIAATLWRATFLASVVVLLSHLYYGAGLVLAVIVILSYVICPALRAVKYVLSNPNVTFAQRVRCALVVALSLLGLIALFHMPVEPTHRAWGIVEYDPLSVVRAESSGFIVAVHAHSGQLVSPGDALVTLENRVLESELRDLELAVAQSELRIRMYRRDRELAKLQAEQKDWQTLVEQLSDKKARCSHLVIRAPSAGRVLQRNLDQLIGTYVRDGDEILALGRDHQKRLRILINQRHLDVLKGRRRVPIRAFIPGETTFYAVLSHIEPEASDVSPEPSLCASYGGPLAVLPTDEDDTSHSGFVLLEPHFSGFLQLAESQKNRILAGQRASILLNSTQTSLGEYLLETIRDRINQRVESRKHHS